MTSLWHIFLAYLPCTRPPTYPQTGPDGEELPPMPRRQRAAQHRDFLRAKRFGRKWSEHQAKATGAASAPDTPTLP
ncbi:uncharacterized protein LOC62_05G007714 [Vanrija pseudolonga]|uniref:Uncharacterized protein n=1 Tax=Vanrija pseudolonga TaxID=143232 RepID=A0AAF1BPK4_9TREE|nr:hypothetical protein LOC62_05G007714 [Vanrija pseudolonga]